MDETSSGLDSTQMNMSTNEKKKKQNKSSFNWKAFRSRVGGNFDGKK